MDMDREHDTPLVFPSRISGPHAKPLLQECHLPGVAAGSAERSWRQNRLRPGDHLLPISRHGSDVFLLAADLLFIGISDLAALARNRWDQRDYEHSGEG